MKIKYLILYILLLASLADSQAQEVFTNMQYGFSMIKPEKWVEVSNETLSKNISNIDISEEELLNTIKSNKNSVLLTSFYKYDPKTHLGLNPTITIIALPNPASTTESFFEGIQMTADHLKKIFNDVAIIKKPQFIEVDHIKSVHFSSKYTIKLIDGNIIYVRTRTYAIPKGKYFFQVTFIDDSANPNEDCSQLFDRLWQTIKIKKST